MMRESDRTDLIIAAEQLPAHEEIARQRNSRVIVVHREGQAFLDKEGNPVTVGSGKLRIFILAHPHE